MTRHPLRLSAGRALRLSAVRALWLSAVFTASSCSLIPKALPRQVALSDLEAPVALFEEPDDEIARLALDPGAFSGLVLSDSRDSLEAMLGEPDGVLVAEVIENSPAHAAGIEVGDLLFEADAGDGPVSLAWPSDWRQVELTVEPGTRVTLLFDRAGAELEAELVLTARVAPPPRAASERFDEEQAVGVVLRTATEVEARSASLAPGAGAVIVGLARSSPWRPAGLRFEDLILSVDGEVVAHPRVLLDRIRAAGHGDSLALAVWRDGERLDVDAPIASRESRLREFGVPLILRYENDGDERSFSLLFGLFGWTSTDAAWRVRLLWLLTFGGGDADRLEEVSR